MSLAPNESALVVTDRRGGMAALCPRKTSASTEPHFTLCDCVCCAVLDIRLSNTYSLDMSLDLRDFRGKITDLTWCQLEAEHRIGGKDQSEIVRAILHEWAELRHRTAIEAQRLMEAEGTSGNIREGEGTAGKKA